jgi:hypothetical protein
LANTILLKEEKKKIIKMHRPTFHAAIGSKPTYGGIRSTASSGKDQAAHTTLKYRQVGQASEVEVANLDRKLELEKKVYEEKLKSSKLAILNSNNEKANDAMAPLLLKNHAELDLDDLKKKYESIDADRSDAESADDFESSR